VTAWALLLALCATPELDRAAELTLPDANDVALVRDLSTGELILEHHGAVAKKARIAPGSVMKAFTAYAILEAGLDRSAYVCKGEHVDPRGHHRPCWDRRGHGEMRLRTALANSCNAWFYATVERIDGARILDAWRRFGIPAAGTADEVPLAIDDDERLDVAVGDHRALAITARTLLDATARLATRDGQSGLNVAHLEAIAHGLEEAARSGTLASTFLGLDVAAKSGTGPKRGAPGTRGLVIGWTPARAPRYVFVLVKDRGRGAKDAGPAARAIAEILGKKR